MAARKTESYAERGVRGSQLPQLFAPDSSLLTLNERTCVSARVSVPSVEFMLWVQSMSCTVSQAPDTPRTSWPMRMVCTRRLPLAAVELLWTA
jgi:hypothetical protein